MKTIILFLIGAIITSSQVGCSTSASVAGHGVSTRAGSGGVGARVY